MPITRSRKMKVLNCTSFINKFAFLYLSILIVTCHGPGSHDEILNDRFHEKVSMEQAKIRLEQLRAGNLMENEAHIRHHLENIAQIPENEMSEEQRSFHFFYIHDTDQNNKLDGLEILHSIMENHRVSLVVSSIFSETFHFGRLFKILRSLAYLWFLCKTKFVTGPNFKKSKLKCENLG